MQEHVYDVIVLGTGAAGLTAALRAAADGGRVGLFEKADTVGGTSAWSGGTVWLPNNRHEVELGFSDSREEVLTYLMSLSHGLMEQPLVEAYVDTAPEVAAWLEDQRWYASKSRHVTGLQIDESVIIGEAPQLLLTLMQARFASGSHELYQLPFALLAPAQVGERTPVARTDDWVAVDSVAVRRRPRASCLRRCRNSSLPVSTGCRATVRWPNLPPRLAASLTTTCSLPSWLSTSGHCRPNWRNWNRPVS